MDPLLDLLLKTANTELNTHTHIHRALENGLCCFWQGHMLCIISFPV